MTLLQHQDEMYVDGFKNDNDDDDDDDDDDG